MAELFAIDNIYNLYKDYQLLATMLIMLIAFYPLLLITKRIISPSVSKIAEKKGKSYSKILDKHHFTARLVHLFIAIYLMFWGGVFDTLVGDSIVHVKNTIITLYLIFSITTALLTAINIAVEMYQTKAISSRVPISLHAHIVKIIVSIFSILSVFSHIMGVSISSLFASLGAAAALLTFVFKDTVLGLLASLQLTFQDIIKVGDWVTMPKYNADGNIEKITITVVVIRNFDSTFTTVPTSAFLTTGVQNWRAMFEKGGRRIKRALSLDIDTVKICDQKLLSNFKKMGALKDLAVKESELFDAKNEMTNIGMFRRYIDQYLAQHKKIHQEGFTFLVRQLAPTETGVPIELYVFTNDTNWVNYEGIQGDIFDHLLGILPQFELKAFQTIIRTK